MLMQSRSHPKLVSRGTEVEEADLKFKGAPADDCDPFAIQNYIDRLAAEVYDNIHGTKSHANKGGEEKDEWELMKEKARSVPFHDVSLSIALKHGLLDEVKKENANKPFEKDNILTIMKVRDEFLQEHADASGFEYQWQIWVEWERYLKQIGVTIPQWGKIARKLIRLGVQRIQEDMTKKYTQISSGANKRKTSDADADSSQDRRRKLTPLDVSTPLFTQQHFSSQPIMRANSFCGFSDSNMYGSQSSPMNLSGSPPSFSPMSSPMHSPSSYPTHPPPFGQPSFPPQVPSSSSPSTFGASLYSMMSPSVTQPMFSTTNPPSPPSSTSIPSSAHSLDTISYASSIPASSFSVENTAALPSYPYDTRFIGTPTPVPPLSLSQLPITYSTHSPTVIPATISPPTTSPPSSRYTPPPLSPAYGSSLSPRGSTNPSLSPRGTTSSSLSPRISTNSPRGTTNPPLSPRTINSSLQPSITSSLTMHSFSLQQPFSPAQLSATTQLPHSLTQPLLSTSVSHLASTTPSQPPPRVPPLALPLSTIQPFVSDPTSSFTGGNVESN